MKAMKSLLTTIALFSLCAATAQPPAVSSGCELPRGAVHPHSSAEAAAAGDSADRSYRRPVEMLPVHDVPEQNMEPLFSGTFTVPFAWSNRQVLIRIASASSDYEVRVNGRRAAYVADSNAPAEVNVTRLVREGRNELEIRLCDPSEAVALESWRTADTKPSVGEVEVLSQPTLRVRDVAVRTWRPTDEGDYMSEVAVVLKSDALNPRTTRLWYELRTPTGRRAVSGHQDLTLDMRREDTVRFLARVPVDSLWSADRPQRYTLHLKTQHAGRYDEYTAYELGLRSVAADGGRLLVNDRPVALRMRELSPRTTPDKLAALRAEGVNAVLLLPGAVAPGLYDACDTLGLYVLAQAPIDTRHRGDLRRRGGNPSNDPAWQAACIERAERSYHTTKRHPSVVAFSLARHSANGICLYETYLAMKRLDDPRPMIYPEAAGEWNTDRLDME